MYSREFKGKVRGESVHPVKDKETRRHQPGNNYVCPYQAPSLGGNYGQ